jgi:hypothetical protein
MVEKLLKGNFTNKTKGNKCGDCSNCFVDEKFLPEKNVCAGACLVALPMFAECDITVRRVSIHANADGCGCFTPKTLIERTLHTLSDADLQKPTKIGPFYLLRKTKPNVNQLIIENEQKRLALTMTDVEAQDLSLWLQALVVYEFDETA